jgi:hypothetical protein
MSTTPDNTALLDAIRAAIAAPPTGDPLRDNVAFRILAAHRGTLTPEAREAADLHLLALAVEVTGVSSTISDLQPDLRRDDWEWEHGGDGVVRGRTITREAFALTVSPSHFAPSVARLGHLLVAAQILHVDLVSPLCDTGFSPADLAAVAAEAADAARRAAAAAAAEKTVAPPAAAE